MIRTALGLILLVVAGYAAWLSTYLLDPGFFRTEGSPAGAGLFVVFLGFPVIALACGVGGALLLVSGRRGGQATRAPRRPSPPPPIVVDSRRAQSADGDLLDVLIQGEIAVVWMRRADGSGLRSHNARVPADGTYAPFRCVDGHPARLPRHWTVPAALARQTLAAFAAGGDWRRHLATTPTPALPATLRGGDDRARWSWLIAQG